MKALLITFMALMATVDSPQILTFNNDTAMWEFAEVYDGTEVNGLLLNRLKATNYTILDNSSERIEALGKTSHLVGGFTTVEIEYKALIEFKDGRYRVKLSGWVLTDKNGSNPLENMKGFTKKWVKIINQKLPGIIESINNYNASDDSW